jgi:hypothetical protein
MESDKKKPTFKLVYQNNSFIAYFILYPENSEWGNQKWKINISD